MASRKLLTLTCAVIFLVIAGASLYRLLVGFPVTIGGVSIGQTVSFLLLAACGALSLMLFREASR
jgi:uncharacterized membrane protein YdjX (TVP38/TMEM64 family)